MDRLPTPPEAWWVNVPWYSYFGFALAALIVVVVVGPWALARTRNLPSAMMSREQALMAREKREDERADAEMAEVRRDRDDGWNKLRAMELLAHQLWHDLGHARQLYNDLLRLLVRVAAGKVSREALGEIVGGMEPFPPAPPVPTLQDIEGKAPHEAWRG